MTIPCTNCGEPLDDDAYRCRVCDALAPLPATGRADDTEVVPWAIPIRDGAPSGSRSRDPMQPVVVAMLAVAALAAMVVIGSQVLGGSGAEVAGPSGPEVQGDAVGTDIESQPDSDVSGTGKDSDTSTSITTTTTSTTTSSTSAPPSTTTTTTTAPPATSSAPSAGSAPRLSSSFDGGWVAQLTSVPTSAGSDVVESAWNKARAYASGAVVARSDDWESLEPGYWVVVDAGPFASAEAVHDYCASIGHVDRSDCLPRQLTGRR